jgi:Carboxypeptidase regulatory-like domain
MNNCQRDSLYDNEPTRNGPTRRVWFSAAARTLLPLAVGVGVAPGFLCAQVFSGSLTGVVSDSAGGAVPNAQVRVTNKQTGESRETRTTSTGSYSVSGLPPGTYDVFVTSSGFKTVRLPDVSVEFGRSATANVSLDIGVVSQPITVENGPRITSRQFLVGDSKEETGYGLYSYILLGRPATDASRERYLSLLREYLALPETSLLKKKVPIRQLNITYLPLTESLPVPTPDSALKAYNFVVAQELLLKVLGYPWVDGPYIVSWEHSLTSVSILPRDHYLFQDLSAVPPEIVIVWVHEFMIQAGQKDYWRKRNGPDAALKLRTGIAQLAAGVDPVRKSVKEWQSILATLIAWKQAPMAEQLTFGNVEIPVARL